MRVLQVHFHIPLSQHSFVHCETKPNSKQTKRITFALIWTLQTGVKRWETTVNPVTPKLFSLSYYFPLCNVSVSWPILGANKYIFKYMTMRPDETDETAERTLYLTNKRKHSF